MSGKLKSPSIIILGKGEGMDIISAWLLLIISLKASSEHEGGGALHDNNNKSWLV